MPQHRKVENHCSGVATVAVQRVTGGGALSSVVYFHDPFQLRFQLLSLLWLVCFLSLVLKSS